MMKKLLLMCCLLTAIAAQAQTEEAVSELGPIPQQAEQGLQWPQTVQWRLDSMMRSPLLDCTQVGLQVWDLTDDHSLFACNHRQLLRPASTMKLLTAIAALDQLGPDYQLHTRLYYKGVVNGRTLIGSVYVVGGMDPLFSHDDMRTFAHSLKMLGADSICGNIVADVSMKDTLRFGEGWCWDDKNPVLSPLLVGRKDQFQEQLLGALQAEGVVVSGVMRTTDRLPKGAVLLCDRKRPLAHVLMQMMKDSDNLFAESVYYQLAASSGRKPARALDAIRLERALMERAGLVSGDYRLADGSGLSLYNYLSAEAEVRLLRYAWRHRRLYDSLLPTLPVAAGDGTLQKRMGGTAAAGNVQAKTGTVTGVSALAGYCTAPNGHRLCFAIINQGVMRAADGRQFQDQVCSILCQP